MKTKISILALAISSVAFAQQTYFQNKIPTSSLKELQKISKELATTYYNTQYYNQTSFDLNQDLKIPTVKDQVIVAKLDKIYRYTNKSESYTYKVANDPSAELVLSKYDNIITGMYVSGSGEKVMYHQVNDNTFAISQVAEKLLIDQDSSDDTIIDKSSIENLVTAKTNSNICSSSTAACSASTVDVMVVYTSAASTAWGGTSQSNSYIATAITNFNTALTNSGITNATINLVYSGVISYTESGDLSTDLSRLRATADGYMDNVHTLRTTYGADLVSLVTSTPTTTCGLGYVNTSPTNYVATAGFSAVLYNCAVSNYSLAHEMGHNMGLRHDWFVDTSTTPCSNHHGYTNAIAITNGTSATSAQKWRTIMAYNDECTSAGISCTRINRWANPAINYNTYPTGVAIGSTNPANEAYGFARFVCVVAGFTPSVTSDILAIEERGTKTKEFAIYPNPAKDIINITTDEKENYSFEIINATGQTLLKTTSKEINISKYPRGEYFINIYSGKNTLVGSKKFLKN
ncbi:M12 family metallo-peptidase [Chryseobacterium sp. RG1]|uniref:M12 family metallo-peptidase n=1 Tax=Chryseobacterium tagetis TaxID=2801334 RepID=A0ABS8A949_9FLAO|nr:zinc-dependent metalloprotease [Chryseobacterium tagetis]MCA6069465.1 M12 family metallo-peptidase [Chryseobacterium tagetis]